MPEPLVPDPHAAILGGAAAPDRRRPEPELRAFGDTHATRRRIFDGVERAVRDLPPLGDDRHTLRLARVRYIDPDHVPRAAHKQATLTGGTVGRRLKGTWELVDNASGRVLAARDQVVARVPYLTGMGTFIHRGNHYTLNHQQRLKPGVYTRIKANGELEAHANVLPGKGISHRYLLDPARGVFKLRIGQAELPLMPLLQAMGVPDARLRDAWGPDLHAANMQANDAGALRKLKERVLRPRELTGDAAVDRQKLIDAFAGMQLDPEVTRRTLGHPHAGLDADAILATTRKLLAVSRREQPPDDRDGLPFQTFHGPEDLFRERVARDHGGLRRQAFFKLSRAGTLDKMPSGLLTPQIEQALLGSGLGQTIEEINPLEVFDKQTRVTRLGEGGIPSVDSVPEEARSVQPTHFGLIDPLRTPESFRAGIDLHLARGARKGADGRLYVRMHNPRTGALEWKTPEELADRVVAFPGWDRAAAKRVPVIKGGEITYVPKRDVDYALPHFEDAFSPLANLIPFKSTVKGQRVAMGSRYLTQALPLVGAEAPLVRGAVPGTDAARSFEEEYGRHAGAVRAVKGGVVVGRDPDSLRVRHDDGTEETIELYNNYPFARKTLYHQTPLVGPGDRFDPGQLLVRSNYTDDKGATALGLNARTAYVPWHGANFEDAVVVSESMAQRLTSEHLYQHDLEVGDRHKLGKKRFVSLFPAKYPRAALDRLDDRGVIRPGAVVQFGDPLIVAAQERELAANKVHKQGQSGYADASVVWKHHDPGIVTDVAWGPTGPTVAVKAHMTAQEGDKLSGRYGDKGIISKIVPDAEMPTGGDGKPFEVLLNPLGIISRTNPSQMHELWLGKVAAHTGRPVNVPDFEDIPDATEWVDQQLRRHGLVSTEDLIDPATGRKIPGVATGSRFFMKLHHTSESKAQGRGTGGYTSEGAPAKGGEAGSKRISMLDVNALLSHGAVATLRDAGAVRGQANEDLWLQFMQGHTPDNPRVPFVYDKFVNSLRAAGIHVDRRGRRTRIMALTDRDVDRLAGDREVRSGATVRFDGGMEPIPGGLFDPGLTGGHGGNAWAAIPLEEPLPNPVMEEPIRRLLDLTQKQFEEVLAGGRDLPGLGTGPRAIARALDRLDLDRALAEARAQVHGSRKTQRDAAIRKLGYLKSARRLGLHPRDWVLRRAPVLPPAFRPVSVMGDTGVPLVADPNYLYRELIEANDNLKAMKGELGEAHVGAERLALYHAFKAVTGLGDPITPKSRERGVQGILKAVFGSGPKFGMMQRKLLSSTVDNVGRAVVAPNPDLDMDTIGLPIGKAFDVYGKFVVRRLRRRGMPLGEALRQLRDRTPLAEEALRAELDARPVYVNRAPVLHRFGIMAFRPRLVAGDVMQVSPLVVKGFGMDFNGDSCVSPLVPILVNGMLYLGDFETFIREYIMSDYAESEAVGRFGRQTVVLEFREGAGVLVPGVGRDGTVGWKAASHLSIHTSHGPDCYRVRTARGLDAVFTAHHNFVTLDETCALVPTKTTGVKAGSLLPLLFGFDTERPGTTACGRPDLVLDYEAGVFVGHYLGDGSLTGRNDTLSQASTDGTLAVYLEGIGSRFTAASPWYEGNGASVRWTDRDLVAWFEQEFGRGFAGKRIAGWCLTAPRAFREGLLVGFLLAEGSTQPRSSSLEIANRRLALGIQAVGSTLGIAATVRPGRPERASKKTDATLSETFVVRFNAETLATQITRWPACEASLSFRRQRDARRQRGGPASHQVWDRVPYPASIADRIDAITEGYVGGRGRWAAAQGRTSVTAKYTALSRKDRNKVRRAGSCTRAFAEKLIDALGLRASADPVVCRWVALVANRELIWDTIIGVEKTDRPDVTYDFHVPDGETFCVDGFFLTHNTAQFHVPTTDDAVREAYDRMLPSRNLLSVADFRSPMHAPGQEYVGGLYAITRPPDPAARPRTFATAADAIAAHGRGDLGLAEAIRILR